MTRRQLFVLLATIIGSGIVIVDGTVVNLALPALGRDLHASFAGLQWVVDGYLLSLSSLILLGGSLGDIFGRKKTYLTGLLGFGIVSLLCGLAPTESLLIGLRVLQGVFGALLVPGGLAIINTNFPEGLRGKAIGQWSAFTALGAAIGPLLGGVLVDTLSWRWVFFINVPLVLICAALAVPNVKESHDTHRRHLDIIGAILAITALAGLTYGLIEGSSSGWSAGPLAAMAAGAVSLGLFLLAEQREKDPMIHLSLFKSRNFSAANITTFAMYGALGGFFFAFVIYLQNSLGYSTLQAGLSAMPVTLLLLLLSGRVGALTGTIGPRLFMTAGPLIAAVGMLMLYGLQPGESYLLHVLPGVTLFGLGMATLVAPLTVTVMSSVDNQESGIASGINNAVARVAGLIVIALLGLFGVAHAYKFTMALCAGLAIVAGIASWLLIRNPVKK